MLSSRFLRCLSTQPCEPSERARGNARSTRAELACARACIARSSLRASRGYACCRSSPRNRNTRSACVQHRRKRQTNVPYFGKARRTLWAETTHLPVFISTNDEAVRIVHQLGSVMGTVPDVEEGSKRHSNAVATHMQLRLRPRLGRPELRERQASGRPRARQSRAPCRRKRALRGAPRLRAAAPRALLCYPVALRRIGLTGL